MTTHSLTRIYDEYGELLLNLHRQHEGYPSGHGLELAAICDKIIINGFSDRNSKTEANGMGCLAAFVVQGIKKGIGGIVLQPVSVTDTGHEYEYEVRFQAYGKPPVIMIQMMTWVGDTMGVPHKLFRKAREPKGLMTWIKLKESANA